MTYKNWGFVNNYKLVPVQLMGVSITYNLHAKLLRFASNVDGELLFGSPHVTYAIIHGVMVRTTLGKRQKYEEHKYRLTDKGKSLLGILVILMEISPRAANIPELVRYANTGKFVRWGKKLVHVVRRDTKHG